jgi:hypothetical protein
MIMQHWEQWIRTNKSKISHIVDFEERFVRDILTKIPEITPNDVVAQYPFQDDKGGNRYIDFCIKNESKGYFVFIELDGKEKFSRDNLEDTLNRQNLIPAKLLRFANTTWLNKADMVIQTISLTLQEQNKIFQEKKQSEDKVKQLTETVNTLVKHLENSKPQYANHISTKQVPNILQLIKDNIESISFVVLIIIALTGLLIYAYTSQKHENIEIGQSNTSGAELVNTTEPVTATTGSLEECLDWAEEEECAIYADKAKQQDNYIYSNQALSHIGQSVTVCGYVAQIVPSQGKTYINLGNRYPQQELGIIIWDNNMEQVKKVLDYGGKTLCVYGEVTTYKNLPQIELSELSQIRN